MCGGGGGYYLFFSLFIIQKSVDTIWQTPVNWPTNGDSPLHCSIITSLCFQSSKLWLMLVLMVRCSVALLKMTLGTEMEVDGAGEGSIATPPMPLPVLVVLPTLAGEGRGEKL